MVLAKETRTLYKITFYITHKSTEESIVVASLHIRRIQLLLQAFILEVYQCLIKNLSITLKCVFRLINDKGNT